MIDEDLGKSVLRALKKERSSIDWEDVVLWRWDELREVEKESLCNVGREVLRAKEDRDG